MQSFRFHCDRLENLLRPAFDEMALYAQNLSDGRRHLAKNTSARVLTSTVLNMIVLRINEKLYKFA